MNVDYSGESHDAIMFERMRQCVECPFVNEFKVSVSEMQFYITGIYSGWCLCQIHPFNPQCFLLLLRCDAVACLLANGNAAIF